MSLSSVTTREQSIYITTSIPYVNARPHIGHALEFVQADVLARFHRLCGHSVRFQIGTDENASKNVQAAQLIGLPTAQLVKENGDRFQALADRLNIGYDRFIRTASDADHHVAVERFWLAATLNGDIYRRQYSGLYCVGCELFYAESELEDGCCPVHNTEPEQVSEENYFFRLSRYQERLEQLIESDRLLIVPESRKNEVLSFVRKGLQDFSISRPAERTGGWGIPVPDDPDQVIYVWFDALINYIAGLGYADDCATFTRYWAVTNQVTHVIGKDIIRFHAIYWPAMLLSGGVPLPKKILVHGFITANGNKISKSAGNIVDPTLLLDAYGADALRYYLIRHVPTTGDANYTEEIFAQSYRADLADQLGNLLQRSTRMIELYADGRVPQPGDVGAVESPIIRLAEELPQRLQCEISADRLHHAIAAVWELIAAVNKYIVDIRPWDLAKERATDETAAIRLDTCLFSLAEALRVIAYGLLPFLPQTAAEIARRLNIELIEERWLGGFDWGQLKAGLEVRGGEPLFPK